jgi:hypothetical protein
VPSKCGLGWHDYTTVSWPVRGLVTERCRRCGRERERLSFPLGGDEEPGASPMIIQSGSDVRHGNILEPADLPPLGLDGLDLHHFFINTESWLRFVNNAVSHDRDDATVMLRCPFRLTVDGVEQTIDPGRTADVGPLLRLYPNTLDTAVVQPDATLRLDFRDGARIEVPPDRFEAWHIAGPGSREIICSPGGGDVTVFE